MKNSIRTSILSGLLILLTVAAHSRIIHITQNGGTQMPQDGSTWAQALDGSKLQSTIVRAQPHDTIWVARGKYFPTTSTTDRAGTFVFPTTTLCVYGGFKGDDVLEPSTFDLTKRDFKNNADTLSGDIDNNDIINADGSVSNNDNNSVQILTIQNVTHHLTLDGFIITDANSFVDATHTTSTGNGNSISNCSVNSVSISNCTFQYTTSPSGALWITCFIQDIDNPVFTNCIFRNNNASSVNGGAVTIASGLGGGQCSPLFSNCIFYDNVAGNNGGQIAIQYQDNTISQAFFINCTLYSDLPAGTNNTQIIGGGTNQGFDILNIANSIIWTANGTGSLIGADIMHVFNSDIQNFSGAGSNGNISTDPLFVKATNPIGADGFWPSYDDGLIPICNSPVVANPIISWPFGGALPGSAMFPPTTDVTGASRNNASGTITMGAYDVSDYLQSATISANPSSVCEGSTATITISGPAGATVIYLIPGGATTSTLIPASGQVQFTTQPLYTSATYTLKSISSSSCSASLNNSATITVTYCPPRCPCEEVICPTCPGGKFTHIVCSFRCKVKCWFRCKYGCKSWKCISFRSFILLIYFAAAITILWELIARIRGGNPGPLTKLWNFIMNIFRR